MKFWQWILQLVSWFAHRTAPTVTLPLENISPPTVPSITLPPNVVTEQPPVAPVRPSQPSLPPKPLLRTFGLAIKSREGFFAAGENPKYPKGTPSWRNNNPGNIKMGGFARNCGAIGQDVHGFAQFPNLAKGQAALELLVRNAATGESYIYKPTDTILQFFKKYAPAEDSNDPLSYATEVALKLGVPISFQIQHLV